MSYCGVLLWCLIWQSLLVPLCLHFVPYVCWRLHSCRHCLDLILLSKGSKSCQNAEVPLRYFGILLWQPSTNHRFGFSMIIYQNYFAYLPYGLAYLTQVKFEIPTAMLQNSRTKGKRIIINIENMANWATTSYRIEGSKSDLKRVFNVIDGFMTAKQKPTSVTTSKDWEGNVVEALGATEEQLSKNYLRT